MIALPKSLSGRLLLGALLLIVASVLATGVAMQFALKRFVQGQVDGRLDGQILAVREALAIRPDGSLHLDHLVDGPPFDNPKSGWSWTVLAAGVQALSPNPPREVHIASLPQHIHARPDTLEGTGPHGERLRIRARTFPFQGQSLVIAAYAPLRALTGPLWDAMVPLGALLLGLAGILAGGVVLQVRLGLRPLFRLTQDLQRVRAGQAERITQPQPSEVRPLVTELNTLLDQNARNLERARRHVANLAHGLKTPLASLALSLDESDRDPDGRLRKRVALMDRRIRHHLARARMAALGGQDRARTQVKPKAADHLEAFRRLYAERQLAFSLDMPADLTVACESQDLDELLGNLLDNACKWARHRVTVGAIADGRVVTLVIEDDGPGLTEQQACDVLQPGKRLDEAAPGYGFGLPIARELAELHGGTLHLARSALGGLRAEATLPAVVAVG